MLRTGDELSEYVAKLGWSVDASTGVVIVPPNPDNQIESTVVQENIQLSRKFQAYHYLQLMLTLLSSNQSWSKSFLMHRLHEPNASQIRATPLHLVSLSGSTMSLYCTTIQV